MLWMWVVCNRFYPGEMRSCCNFLCWDKLTPTISTVPQLPPQVKLLWMDIQQSSIRLIRMRSVLQAYSLSAWVTLLGDTLTCKKHHLLFDGTVRTFRFDTAASSEWLKHPPNFEHISHMIWLKGKRAPCDGADLERLPCHGNLLSLVRASFHPSAWGAEVQNLRR